VRSRVRSLALASLAIWLNLPCPSLTVVDDKLDLVNSQVELKEKFTDILSGSESRLSLEEKSEVIAARVAPILADRPAFAQVRFVSTCLSSFCRESQLTCISSTALRQARQSAPSRPDALTGGPHRPAHPQGERWRAVRRLCFCSGDSSARQGEPSKSQGLLEPLLTLRRC